MRAGAVHGVCVRVHDCGLYTNGVRVSACTCVHVRACTPMRACMCMCVCVPGRLPRCWVEEAA